MPYLYQLSELLPLLEQSQNLAKFCAAVLNNLYKIKILLYVINCCAFLYLYID